MPETIVPPPNFNVKSTLLSETAYCECCGEPMTRDEATLVERGLLLMWSCPVCLSLPPAILPDDVTCRVAAGLALAAQAFTDPDRRGWLLEVAESFLDGSLIVEVR